MQPEEKFIGKSFFQKLKGMRCRAEEPSRAFARETLPMSAIALD
jgi:hypothetical protein